VTAGIDCRRLLLVKNQTWCRSHAGDRAPPGHYIRNHQPDRNSCTEHMHIRSSDNCLRKRRDGFQHAKRRCVSTIEMLIIRNVVNSFHTGNLVFCSPVPCSHQPSVLVGPLYFPIVTYPSGRADLVHKQRALENRWWVNFFTNLHGWTGENHEFVIRSMCRWEDG
jgi:hypothetical protein